MSITDQYEDLLKYIRNHPEFRERLREALFLDEYVRRSDLIEIVTELKHLREDMNRELALLREDSNKRFEAQTKELALLREDSNKRFEEHSNEMKSLAKELARLREESSRRFEEHSNEMKSLAKELARLREESSRRFEELLQYMERRFTLLSAELAEFSSKSGHQREAEIRQFLIEFLKSQNLPVEKIKHYRIIDEKGVVFRVNYVTDVDIYYESENGVWLFELKASVDHNDVFHFNKICQLFELAYKKEVRRKIISCYKITDEGKVEADVLGIEVWLAEITKGEFIRPSELLDN